MITHDKSKSFACPYENCGKSFKRQDALRVHIQSHSEKPQFVCSIPGCQAKYKSKPALKYHLSKHHISELKLMSHNPREQNNSSCLKIQQKEPLHSQRKRIGHFPEERDPKPQKFLFKEGGETKPSSSKRTLVQELSKNDDEELKDLMFLYGHLLRENRELKRQVADQMLSTQDSETYEKLSFVSFE